MPPDALAPLLRPASIALVGASGRAGSVGRLLLSNLIEGGFGGPIFAINPHEVRVDAATWLASVEDLPKPAGLAIVATPAEAVPSVIAALGRSGTRVAVVVSGGLTDTNGLTRSASSGPIASASWHLMRGSTLPLRRAVPSRAGSRSSRRAAPW